MNLKVRRYTHPLFSIFILAALLLSSCGTLFPTPEPVKITFAFDQADQAYFESLLPGFQEKNPSITVELKPFSEQSIALDADVTVVSWTSTLGTTETFESLLPLDSFISQQKDYTSNDFYPGTLEAFSNEGKQYAVPLGVDPWVMYYNKDLFDRYGVPYPQPGWDWTDFLDKAMKLRDPEYTVYGFASMNDQVEAIIYLYQHGGALTDGTNPTINTAANVEAIRGYVSLFREYNVAPTDAQVGSELGAGGAGVYYGMLNGKVAMFILPLSYRGGDGGPGIPGWTFKWGVLPVPRGENTFTVAFFDGLAITKQSTSPEAGWKWIDYVTHQPHNRFLPARISLAESPEFSERIGSEVAQAGLQSMPEALITSRQRVGSLMGVVEVFSVTIHSLVNKDLIVQDELDKAQAQAEGQTQ